ncbi:hypothetical protein HJG60_008383 [Phyllostomus discolor]|uniref:Uncharacterized protein n=1 Tax=Phyllostomus discolor TaxID=89673 RepID=A0A833Z4W9_9CHIR|nr:hypothetical protein HJG60_008383 [Phyllostomus discolor]
MLLFISGGSACSEICSKIHGATPPFCGALVSVWHICHCPLPLIFVFQVGFLEPMYSWVLVFFIHSNSLCLLMNAWRLFIFKVIIDMVGFVFGIFVTVFIHGPFLCLWVFEVFVFVFGLPFFFSAFSDFVSILYPSVSSPLLLFQFDFKFYFVGSCSGVCNIHL